MEKKITDFINGKVTFDNVGETFWINNNYGIQMLAQLRGWEHVRNMFAESDNEGAKKFNDRVGEFIAEAINEKLEREKIVNK